MKEPQSALAALLRIAVTAAFGAEHAGVDPMVRRSERADYQADLAMGLAKTLRQSPRQVAAAIVAAADFGSLCDRVEIAGPGFINFTLKTSVLEQGVAAVAADEQARRAAAGAGRSRRDRLLGAERGQGNARGSRALDDHRRCSRAGARARGARSHSPEPHRRLGHAVRHADRAPDRCAAAGRRAPSRASAS